jgi:Abortive infection alpha
MDDLSTEAAKQALQPIGDMLRKIAGPLADEMGESLGVVARHYRYRLAVKMYQKTERMLTDAGINPHAVPPRLFLPMIENASMQDDEELHTRWAALLANAAASPDSVHPSFIEVLRQLTPRDAHLLDELYDSCVEKRRRTVQPWVETITWAERERRIAAGENPKESFDNLIRLGLIDTQYELDADKIKVKMPRSGVEGVLAGVMVDAKLDSDDYLTDFAMRFVQACRAPAVTIEGQATESR